MRHRTGYDMCHHKLEDRFQTVKHDLANTIQCAKKKKKSSRNTLLRRPCCDRESPCLASAPSAFAAHHALTFVFSR
ncbi:Isonitrile hydratase [Fusarium oxysporum f. sp. albedinis]|nr:Isonitrile hydratase [Fusarium oxysporum f. sp. albedinis]